MPNETRLTNEQEKSPSSDLPSEVNNSLTDSVKANEELWNTNLYNYKSRTPKRMKMADTSRLLYTTEISTLLHSFSCQPTV